jgi:hypothetical protein
MRRVIVKSATSKLVSSCVQITCPSECTFCSGQCPVLTIIQWFRVRFVNIFMGKGGISFVAVLCVVCTLLNSVDDSKLHALWLCVCVLNAGCVSEQIAYRTVSCEAHDVSS